MPSIVKLERGLRGLTALHRIQDELDALQADARLKVAPKGRSFVERSGDAVFSCVASRIDALARFRYCDAQRQD